MLLCICSTVRVQKRRHGVVEALPEKSVNELLLCETSEFFVPLWLFFVKKVNHGDTEDSEVAQRAYLDGDLFRAVQPLAKRALLFARLDELV